MSSQRSRDPNLHDPVRTRRSNRKRYWPVDTADNRPFPTAALPVIPTGQGALPMPVSQVETVEKHFSYDDPLVRDHLIFSEQVLIGATYVSMAIEWAAKHFGDTRLVLRRVTFANALRLKPGESAAVSLAVAEERDFYDAASKYLLISQEQSQVAARFQIHKESTPWPEEHVDSEHLLGHGGPQWDGDIFYRHPAQECYGPSLRSVERVVRLREGVVFGRIRVTETMLNEFRHYLLHPCILDACHVVSSFSLDGDPVENHRVPLMIKRVEVASAIDAAILNPCYCQVQRIKFDAQLAEMDISLYDASGRRILVMEGFTTKSVPTKSAIFDRELDQDRNVERPKLETLARQYHGALAQHDLESAIQQYLKQKIAKFLKANIAEVSVTRNFMELGLESHSMIAAVGDIEAEFGIELYPTLFFEYQSIDLLASHFKEEHGGTLAAFFERTEWPGGDQAIASSHAAIVDTVRADALSPKTLPAATVVGRAPRPEQATPENVGRDAIAIIGMSGYLPGAANLSEFWQHLITGRDLVEEIPKNRWDYRQWFDKDPNAVNKTYSKWGSFIDDVDKFDPQFFAVSPRVADWMDPQVRLLLQCAQQTFEDAGVINNIRGSKTDVYVGSCYHEYWDEVVRQHIPFADYQSHSSARSFLSATISYTFDLQGASIPLDNACASSLTALHLGCQAIRQGECDQALVAGVNLLLSPLHYVHFSRLRALSPSGRCHTFDWKADGYVPGEGVVAVLIKPLAKAIADGDNIHAIIRATAINHVGRSNNPTSPRPELQVRMLLNAWAKAGINPRHLSYLEAHGTGTKLGDPIEINALKKAFETEDRQFCAIGSTKAHIGHLEGAAGLASLIKVILMMKHQKIPRMPNFERLNDYIDLKNSPFYINTEVEEWKTDGDRPRLAGISAFGMTGNNAHVVLEEYRNDSGETYFHDGAITTPEISSASVRVYALPLSAKSEEQLRQYAEKLLAHLGTEQLSGTEEGRSHTHLASLAYTLQVGRQAFSHRVVFLALHLGELKDSLRDFINGRTSSGSYMSGSVPDEEQTTSRESGSVVQGPHRVDQRQLAERWVRGLPADWKQSYGDARPRKISLPTYPFRKQRYWMARTPDMVAHPPPDIDLNFFKEASTGKQEQLSLPERAVQTKHATGVQATPVSWLGKHGSRVDDSRGHWLEQVLPARESEWLQMIMARHGQRVLVIVRDEQQFREVAQLFERIAAIVSQPVFEVVGVQVAHREEPSLDAPSAKRFDPHDHDSLAAYVESLRGQNPVPHLVLYVAHASPHGNGMTAQWQWFTRLVEYFAEEAPQSEMHFVAVFEPQGVEPTHHMVELDNLGLGSPRTTARHHHKVVWVDKAIGVAERAVLAINEWLWDENNAALVAYRGGQRLILATQRKAARTETIAFEIKDDAYGFLRKQWRQKPVARKAEAYRNGDCLILVNENSQHLLAEIPTAGEFRGNLIVAFGDDCHLSNGMYLPFDRPQALHVAMSRLLEQYPGITSVVDLSDLFYQPRESDGDKLGKIALFQQLIKRFQSLSILHITKGLQTYLCEAPSLAGARIAGLFRMLSAEYTHVRCKSIDLDDSMMRPRTAWRVIAEELRSEVEETEICYRNGLRYAACIQEDSWSSPAGDVHWQDEFPVEAREAYVITGGTSGVGLEIARYLAARGARNLALMGNTVLPAREQWQGLISQPDTSEHMRTKLMALGELEQSGVRLFLYAGDLTDETQLGRYLDAVRKQCGSIRGVIHSAGAMQRMREANAAFVKKKIEDIQATLSPKVDGLHSLARQCANDTLQFFVVFSSVAGSVPTFMRGLSDYAAANAYLEHFVAYQNKRGNRFYRAIVWTGWQEAGSHARTARSGSATGPNTAEQAVGEYGLRFNDNVSGRWLFERAMMKSSEEGVLWPTLLERETFRNRRQQLMVADASFAREEAKIDRNTSTSASVEDANERAVAHLIEILLREGRQAAEPLLATIDIDSLSKVQVEQLSHYLLDDYQEHEPIDRHRDDFGNGRQDGVELNEQRREREIGYSSEPGSVTEAVPRATPRLDDIKVLLKKEFAAVLKIDGSALSEQNSFQSYGLDSISGMQLAVAIERILGIDVSPAWLVEYPNIHTLGQKIATELEQRPV